MRVVPCVCVRPTVNSWSGQHPYRWHCGSHAPREEYEDGALRPEWPSQLDKQWVSSPEAALKRAHANSCRSATLPVFVSESCCLFLRDAGLHRLRLPVQQLPVPRIPGLPVTIVRQRGQEGWRLRAPGSASRYTHTYISHFHILTARACVLNAENTHTHTGAIVQVCEVPSVCLLPPWQERGRSACSSSSLRCCRPHPCGVVSGGSSPPPAHFSSPPKIKSIWLSCGGGGRVIARP